MYAHKYARVLESMNLVHTQELAKLLETDNHVLVNGPDMNNTMRVVSACLHDVYPIQHKHAKNWVFETHVLNNETRTEITLQTRGSSRVFELFLVPQGTVDKHVVRDVVQSKIEVMMIDTSFHLTKHVVVLYNVDKLRNETQITISVLMKRFSASVKFVLVTAQASGIAKQITSVAMFYLIPGMDTHKLARTICALEGVEPLTLDETSSDSNRAMNAIMRRKVNARDTLADSYDELCNKIVTKSKITEIRADLYNLLVNNVDPVNIVKEIAVRLLRVLPHRLVCGSASEASVRLVNCERAMYHLEAFVQHLV